MLRLKSFVLLFFIFIFAPAAAFSAQFFDAVVENVLEGDTFILRGGTVVKCYGVDVPHVRGGNADYRYMPVARDALKFAKSVLEKKRVRIEILPYSRKGKKMAYIFVGGRSFNALLLEKGYGVISKDFSGDNRYNSLFFKSQLAAVSKHAGVWRIKEA